MINTLTIKELSFFFYKYHKKKATFALKVAFFYVNLKLSQ